MRASATEHGAVTLVVLESCSSRCFWRRVLGRSDLARLAPWVRSSAVGISDLRRRRRWLVAAVAVVIVLGGAALVIRSTLLRDRSRAVPVEAVLERYRSSVPPTGATVVDEPASTVSADEPAPTVSAPVTDEPASTVSAPIVELPRPGVYRYRTSGEESIDALDGATHTYPAETTITVTPDGCGVRLRWDALKERNDEWRLCATARGVALDRSGVQYHEFFGQSTPEAVECPDTVVLVPVDPTFGEAVELACTLDSDPWAVRWESLGRTTRDVAGQAVPAVHVRMTVDQQDEFDELTTVDWYLDAHGLPLAVAATKQSRSPSPVGTVTYRERYTLEIESLDPLE
jgi:hypothetical protein